MFTVLTRLVRSRLGWFLVIVELATIGYWFRSGVTTSSLPLTDDAVYTGRLASGGKLQTTGLDSAKVFPSNPIQVKMIYNATFEKGNAQEWFTWNIYGDDVRLFEYRITPGWDK
jgi:hypothetical protein